MLAVPMTISEQNPEKPHPCIDHSADPFSRDDMIPKAPSIAPLDVLYVKCDVSRASLTLPMHPLSNQTSRQDRR